MLILLIYVIIKMLIQFLFSMWRFEEDSNCRNIRLEELWFCCNPSHNIVTKFTCMVNIIPITVITQLPLFYSSSILSNNNMALTTSRNSSQLGYLNMNIRGHCYKSSLAVLSFVMLPIKLQTFSHYALCNINNNIF